MKEQLSNDKGNTLVEIIMVMVLLMLFGITIYTLIVTGTNAQQRIIKDKDEQVNARIALSYINVKLKQNDEKDKIAIVENPNTGESAILIKDRMANGSDTDTDTWVYFSDGFLREQTADIDALPDDSLSFVIVDIAGFNTVINDNGTVNSTVEYTHGETKEQLTNSIELRSYSK